MAYYKHENYFSESDMKGWGEERKAAQRELNWDLRLEHYAVCKPAMFVKMVDEWAARFSFPCAGVSTMKLLYILKLARQNGIVTNTILRFCSVEEHLLEKCPSFSSPAAVTFNTEKYRVNCRAKIATMRASNKKTTNKKQ
jgi:hypothetical protein